MIIAVLILVVTFASIYIPSRFYRNEKRKCQKYAFYRLRDDVIWAIVTTDEPQRYVESYDRINSVVSFLHRLTLRSFLGAQASMLADMLTEALVEGKESSPPRVLEFNEFDERYLDLTLEAAKKNSLLLRFAMTKAGYQFFRAPIFVGGFMKFTRRHKVSVKVSGQLRAAKTYSRLGEFARSSDHHAHPSSRAVA